MKDLLWTITTFDANNALPFITFDAPYRPIVSIARATNKIKQLLALLKRGNVTIHDLCQIKYVLFAVFGIDIACERWTISPLIAAMTIHRAHLETLFELMPYYSPPAHDNGLAQFETCMFATALYYVRSVGICNEQDWSDFINLLNRLSKIKSVQGAPLYENNGQIRIIDMNVHIKFRLRSPEWPISLLCHSLIDREAFLTRTDKEPANIYIDVLRAYLKDGYVGEQQATEFMNSNAMRAALITETMIQIYENGNYEFIEAIAFARANASEHNIGFVPYSLLRRAVQEENNAQTLTFSESLRADTLAHWKSIECYLNVELDYERSIYIRWISFMSAIGIPICFAIPEHCFRSDDIEYSRIGRELIYVYYAFGTKTINNYATIGIELDKNCSNEYLIYFADSFNGILMDDGVNYDELMAKKENIMSNMNPEMLCYIYNNGAMCKYYSNKNSSDIKLEYFYNFNACMGSEFIHFLKWLEKRS